MKKALAVFLAMLMVLSCLPGAMADTNGSPDGTTPHTHVWGVDPGQPPTCTEPGTDYWFCYECQYFEERHPAPTGHFFSEWVVFQDATPDHDGLMHRMCSVCSKEEIKSFPYEGSAAPAPDHVPVPVNPGMPELFNPDIEADTGISLGGNNPGPFSGMSVGDTFTCDLAVINTGKKTIESFTVFCDGMPVYTSFNPLPSGVVAPVSHTFFVTQEMLDEGIAEAQYYAVANYAAAADAASDTWDMQVIFDGAPSIGHPELILTVSKAAPIKSEYNCGDVVAVNWTVTNVGDKDAQLSELQFNGGSFGGTFPVSGIVEANGGSVSGTVSPLELPLLNDDAFLDGKATVAISFSVLAYEDNTSFLVEGPMLTYNLVLRSLDEWVPEEDPVDSPLTLTKTVISTPAAPAGYGLGETIEYQVVVTNTGDKVVSDVIISDGMNREVIQIDDMAPGDTRTLTYTHTVDQNDILSTFITNVAAVTGRDPETDIRYPYITDDVTVPILNTAPYLQVSKQVISTPQDPNGYHSGEVVTYQVTITNPTGYRLVDLKGLDSMFNMTVIDGITLDPYTSYTATYSVMVSGHDAMNGLIINSFSAYATVEDTGELVSDRVLVSVPVVNQQEGDLTLLKSVVSTPANGSYYVPGEVVTFMLTLENRSQHHFYVEVYDHLSDLNGGLVMFGHMEPEQTYSWYVDYEVTALDVDLGVVVNSAYVNAKDITDPGYTATATSNEVMVLVGPPKREMEVVKTVESTPANGSFYTLNETVEYTIFVLNPGNEEYTFDLRDNLAGNDFLLGTMTLPAYSCTATTYYHQVTADDVAHGYIDNFAYAVVEDTGDVFTSIPVIVETGAANDLRVVKDVVEIAEDGILYSITVYNDNDFDIEGVTVTDHPGSREAVSPWLETTIYAHSSHTNYILLTITEKDLEDGVQTNQASATAPGYGVFWSNITRVPLDHPDPIDPVPVPTDPDPSVPDPSVPDPSVPDPSVPDPSVPDPSVPDPSVPDPSVPDPSVPDPSVPDTDDLIPPAEFVVDINITISKVEISNPANGFYYTLGETIQYQTVVEMQGTDVVNGTIFDNMISSGDAEYNSVSVTPSSPGVTITSYVVTETDVTRGYVQSQATFYGDDLQPVDSNIVTSPCGADPFGVITDVEVVKSVVDTPSNGMYYVEDEFVDYEAVITNHGEIPVELIIITDYLSNGTVGSWNLAFTLAPDESYTVPFAHRVYPEDVTAGSITDFVIVSTSIGDFVSNEVTVPTGEKVIIEEGPIIGLQKTVTSIPANGLFYTEGEWIDYDIAIVNYDAAIDGDFGNLIDILNDTEISPLETANVLLTAGSVVHYEFHHQVTAEDAARGYVKNTAACDSSYGPLESTVYDPCGYPILDVYETPSLEIAKYVISAPANGLFYTEGEWIDFEIVITNTGSQDVFNASIEDNMNSTGPIEIAFGMDIPAGATVSGIYYSHQVDAADIARGYVTNVATVLYSEGYVNSNVVKVPVGEPAPTIPDSIPTISGETCCERILNGLAPNGAAYTMHFCDKHNAIVKETADADWAVARALWADAINEMYDICFTTATTGNARAIAQQERALFWSMVDAREALILANGQDTAELNTLLQMHCADLCCMLHTAPELRRDSITNAVPALEIPDAAECVTTMGETREDGFDYSLTICADHARAEATVQQLVLDAEGNDALAAAFVRAQRLYQTELDSLTNQLYRAAGDSKDLVSADRIAFGAWVKNHISFLTLLYGDNFQPQEIASRHIANRISQLCG